MLCVSFVVVIHATVNVFPAPIMNLQAGVAIAAIFQTNQRARARARLPLRCEDDLNGGWSGRNAIVGHDDYEHEHR